MVPWGGGGLILGMGPIFSGGVELAPRSNEGGVEQKGGYHDRYYDNNGGEEFSSKTIQVTKTYNGIRGWSLVHRTSIQLRIHHTTLCLICCDCARRLTTLSCYCILYSYGILNYHALSI